MATSTEGDKAKPVPTNRTAAVVSCIVTLLLFTICLTWFARCYPRRRCQVRALRTQHHAAPQHSRNGISRSVVKSFPLVRYNMLASHPNAGDSMSMAVLSAFRLPNVVDSITLGASGVRINKNQQNEQCKENCILPGGMLSNVVTDNCSICTEDFLGRDVLRVLPCRHFYHRYCIDPWLVKAAGTCPLWYAFYPSPAFHNLSQLTFTNNPATLSRVNVHELAAQNNDNVKAPERVHIPDRRLQV
jgi:hypothetical protein